MKVYISGKMTGLPDLGRRHFALTTQTLQECGNIVLNPGVLPAGLERGDYMPICLAMIDAADTIYMLHNYEDSEGAKLELAYALYRGKRVVYETDAESAGKEELFGEGQVLRSYRHMPKTPNERSKS